MSALPHAPASAAAPSQATPAVAPIRMPAHTGWLDVGNGHELYHEIVGEADGLPVVFLHGGPGGSIGDAHRALFDPARFRTLLFDQRGCGRSRPRGGLAHNTTADLVDDIERLREHLGVARWLVAGGSWGAALALRYAQTHPQRCTGLLLRGSFLARRADLDWFFDGARALLPIAWSRLATAVTGDDTPAAGTLLPRLCATVLGDDAALAHRAAQAWQAWEIAVSARRDVGAPERAPEPPHEPTPEPAPEPAAAAKAGGADPAALLDKFRVQAHYLLHDCFLREGALLRDAPALAGLPVTLLHGRLDWVCAPAAAWTLHRALPGSTLVWVDDAGHGQFEAPMRAAWSHAASSQTGVPGRA